MPIEFTADALLALVTLTAMEIVLGIDNIIFVAIIVGRLPQEKQEPIRKMGIALALITRLALLFSITWVMGLTETLFTVGKDWTGKDLILLLGGLFLIAKSTTEIHEKLEAAVEERAVKARDVIHNIPAMLVQIMILDIVFSLDSVITAVGMAKDLWVMATAMTIAVAVMLFLAGSISHFVHQHPTLKMLALSFLLLIGVMLVAESVNVHVDKAFIYFAMAFSLGVELLNMRMRKPAPVALHESTFMGEIIPESSATLKRSVQKAVRPQATSKKPAGKMSAKSPAKKKR
ncbi:MAG: TerC family protein [Deltaproteobacteria bacterium]|nr:TerC family protein [Deltaproteobacteria bacterium]